MQKSKKLLAGIACLSLMGSQLVFADPLPTTGQVLENIGTGGADIVSSTGSFQGFSSNQTNANLHFGSGDAIINWGNLNVGNGQTLNFVNNAGQAVLNNVTGGNMSTFAGSINCGNGNVIISNPNGMTMLGGQINAGGAVVLTTENLTDVYLDSSNKLDLYNTNHLGINDPLYYGDNIVIHDINAVDSNKRISLKDSSISVFDGQTLSTTDGVNYVFANPVASTTGKTTLSTNEGITVNGADFIGDLSLEKMASSFFNCDGATDTTISGGIIANSINGDVEFKNTTANTLNCNSQIFYAANTKINGNVNITTTDDIYIKDSNMGDTVLIAGSHNSYTPLELRFSQFKSLTAQAGDAVATRKCGNISLYEVIIDEDFTANTLFANVYSTILVNGGSIGGNANLKTSSSGAGNDSRIVIGEDWDTVNVNRTSIGGTLTTNTPDDTFIFAEGTLNVKDSYAGGDYTANVANGDLIIDGLEVVGKTILQATGRIIYKDLISENVQISEYLSNTSINEEAARILNGMNQQGLSPETSASQFTPIAFAASEDKDSAKRKIANASSSVYKSKDNVIHISERFNMD